MLNLSQNNFLKKLLLKNHSYREGIFEVLGNYVRHKDKILIKDAFGICSISTNSLLNGSAPSIRSAVNKSEYAAEVFKNVHGNNYDYSNFEFVSAKHPSNIVCKVHGIFTQTYDVHKKGHGCPKCYYESRTKTLSDFKNQASIVHGDEFDYANSFYTIGSEKIEILCRAHGSFWQSPNSHLSGQKCPECYREVKGWTKTHFVNFCIGKKPIFYILRLFNEDENFFKLGVTSKSVKNRFKSKHEMPYSYKILHEVQSEDASFIWELEQTNKKLIRDFLYEPLLHFDGKFECFQNLEKIDIILT